MAMPPCHESSRFGHQLGGESRERRSADRPYHASSPAGLYFARGHPEGGLPSGLTRGNGETPPPPPPPPPSRGRPGRRDRGAAAGPPYARGPRGE